MKGDKTVIFYFNRLLCDEFIAVNQFFLHSKMFKNWGLEKLSNIEYQECMDELDHASIYTNRILFLEGTPALHSFDALNVSKNIEDMLRMDLKLEYTSISHLKESIKYTDSVEDYVSKEIMLNILKEEEDHVAFLETELSLIIKMGMGNYIQSQLN